jgi:hypothetical protein
MAAGAVGTMAGIIATGIMATGTMAGIMAAGATVLRTAASAGMAVAATAKSPCEIFLAARSLVPQASPAH